MWIYAVHFIAFFYFVVFFVLSIVFDGTWACINSILSWILLLLLKIKKGKNWKQNLVKHIYFKLRNWNDAQVLLIFLLLSLVSHPFWEVDGCYIILLFGVYGFRSRFTLKKSLFFNFKTEKSLFVCLNWKDVI